MSQPKSSRKACSDFPAIFVEQLQMRSRSPYGLYVLPKNCLVSETCHKSDHVSPASSHNLTKGMHSVRAATVSRPAVCELNEGCAQENYIVSWLFLWQRGLHCWRGGLTRWWNKYLRGKNWSVVKGGRVVN